MSLDPTLETLLGALNEGVILLSAEGHVLTCNPRGAALWPKAREAGTLAELGLPSDVVSTPGYRGPLPGGLTLAIHGLPEGRLALLLSPAREASPESTKEGAALTLYSSLLHDLRNPMAGVPMLVQAFEFEREHLERGGGNHDVCFNYMNRISGEVRRMVRFLDFTRNLATPWTRSQSFVSGAGVIKKALERDRGALQRLGLGVDGLPGGGYFFEADAQGAHQAYSNLLGVALMRQKMGGEPIICGERGEADTVALVVSARGGGFGAARWDDVLAEPAPSPKRLTGVELALFTVRYLAEASGGTLEMSRGELGRVEARIRFPRVGDQS